MAHSVLLIDDDTRFAVFLGVCLERGDPEVWEYVHVSTIDEAKNYLSQHESDIVLLDTTLPDMQGIVAMNNFILSTPQKTAILVLMDWDDIISKEASPEMTGLSAIGFMGKSAIVRSPLELFSLMKACIEKKQQEQRVLAPTAPLSGSC